MPHIFGLQNTSGSHFFFRGRERERRDGGRERGRDTEKHILAK